jgi:hypothetical protein
MVSRPDRLGVSLPSVTRDQLFSFPSILLDSYGFVDVGRPLWREVGCVVFSCLLLSNIRKLKSGHMHQKRDRQRDELVDWPSVAKSTSTSNSLEPGRSGWGSFRNRYNTMCSPVPWDLRKAAITVPSKNWKPQTRLLVREGAQHQQIRSCLEITKERRRNIDRESQIGSWRQDRLADWPSVVIL